MSNWRTLSIAIGAAVALALASFSPALAEEPQAPAPAESMMKDMPGCPGSPNGACCGSCQEAKKDLGAQAEDAGGGCPCQRRARLMAQKQAAEQAAQQQQQ